jgi:hypothetical protein
VSCTIHGRDNRNDYEYASQIRQRSIIEAMNSTGSPTFEQRADSGAVRMMVKIAD